MVLCCTGPVTQALADGSGPSLPLPNEQATRDAKPIPRGTAVVEAAPSLNKGVVRAVAPNSPPPGPGGNKAAKKVDQRASSVANKVKLFLELAGEQGVKITQVRESAILYEVTWRAKAPKGAKAKTRDGRVWVTLDGRYMTRRAVELAPALKRYRKERRYIDCLKGRGARVLLKPGLQGTVRQLKFLGVFGQDLVIWCSKEYSKLCAMHGDSYPRWIWAGGSRQGVLDPKVFEAQMGCKR